MTGPKAAPKTPRAFSTRPIMVPELGLEAMNTAMMAIYFFYNDKEIAQAIRQANEDNT